MATKTCLLLYCIWKGTSVLIFYCLDVGGIPTIPTLPKYNTLYRCKNVYRILGIETAPKKKKKNFEPKKENYDS